ncbi:hypothetical protein MANES_01G193900v8 [Manihot esculenta]|uniref:Uncharacterized protein n=1 Tax=Manihot esculenta TaxID=3983 RepID=A0A2C9WM70_MANES|nr:hypothetical protein MANES_01G193900v8 [Manihot esculenta]
MAYKARNKKKCLCEKTMELVVNIVKLSSISLANMSLRSTLRRLPAAAATGRLVPVMESVDAINISSASQHLPARNINSPGQEEDAMEDIDAKASNYIRKIREKNLKDWNSAQLVQMSR